MGTVDIPDAGLRRAVEVALGNKPVTREAMAHLDELYGTSRGIRNLEGIQHAVNLQTLLLHDNEIKEVSQLVSLTKLQRLGLVGNKIVDVSPLHTLTMLVVLGLNNNEIEDVSQLHTLKKLERLYIEGNEIKDVSQLLSLKKLRRLHIIGHASELEAAGWTRDHCPIAIAWVRCASKGD